MDYPGFFIQRGSEGEPVKAIQKRLGIQLTGVFGPTTEEIVTNFQRSRGLEADGVVGPDTWKALFAPEPAPSSDIGIATLAEARKFVGTREKPLGSNRGPEVDQWNRTVGAPLGSFWCMSFVFSMVKKACEKLGKPVAISKTASCSSLFRWAKANGRLVARPEPGDIFLCIGGPTGHFHTGLVEKLLPDERFSTIEGNSNDEGSANGIEVAHRKRGRRLASCHYVRL
jgi:hypothetical protein